MKHPLTIISVLFTVSLGVTACNDEPFDPDATTGRIILKVLTDPQLDREGSGIHFSRAGLQSTQPNFDVEGTLTHLESVSARIAGTTGFTETQDLLPGPAGFEGEFTEVEPDVYELTLTGRVGGEIDHFGRTPGIEVVAGETAEPPARFPSFVPVLTAFTSPTTNPVLTVNFTTIAAADSFDIEVATSSAFSGASTTRVAGSGQTVDVGPPGMYFLRVRAFAEAVGRGRASEPESLEVRVASTPINPGDVVLEQISAAGEVDQYTFAAAAGDGLNLVILPDSTLTLDPDARLSPINGATLGGDLDNVFGSGEWLVTLGTSANTKTLQVRGAGATTGGYFLFYQQCFVFPASYGAVINDSLFLGDCLAANLFSGSFTQGVYVTFNGSTGDSVTITHSSVDFDAALFLFGPDSRIVASDDDGGGALNSLIGTRLPSSGTYIIFATSFDPDTPGAFTLTISGPAGFANATAPVSTTSHAAWKSRSRIDRERLDQVLSVRRSSVVSEKGGRTRR